MECIICYDAFTGNSGSRESSVAALPCGHFFHSLCILRWLEQSPRCPICRVERKVFKMLQLYGNWPTSNDTMTASTSKAPSTQMTGQANGANEEKIAAINNRIRGLIEEIAEVKSSHELQLRLMHRNMAEDKNALVELRDQVHHYEVTNRSLKTQSIALKSALEEKSKQVEELQRVVCVQNILEQKLDRHDETLLNTYIKTNVANQDTMMKALLLELSGSRQQLNSTMKQLEDEKKSHDATKVRARVAMAQLCEEQAKTRKISTMLDELKRDLINSSSALMRTTSNNTTTSCSSTTERSSTVDMRDKAYTDIQILDELQNDSIGSSSSSSSSKKVNIPTSRLITNNLHSKRIIGMKQIMKTRPPGHYTFDGMGGSTRKLTSSPLGRANSHTTLLFGGQRNQLFNSKR